MSQANGKPLAVFDLDGTLYKTECVSLRAVHSAIQDAELPDKDNDTIRSLFGYTTPELCAHLFPELSKEAMAMLSDRVRHYERSLIREHGQLYEGIRDLLQSLKSEGWALALCTNSSEPYVDTVLSGLDLWEFFDVVRWKSEMKTKADKLQDIVSSQEALCVMIGDRSIDIEAAMANHLPSIAVLWGYGTTEELGQATFTSNTIDDLKAALARCRLYHNLLSSLKAKAPIGLRPSIVGINGVDTAGKTCFTKEFASYLQAYGYDVLCVHIDDFHNEKAKRVEGPNEIQAYINNAFNLDVLRNKILAPFHKTGMLDEELTLLDLSRDEYLVKKRFVANERSILLLEGTLLFRAPIDQYLDYRIFLDISFHEVISRAQIRDVPRYGAGILESYQKKYIPIQKWYLEELNPDDRADVLIENTDFNYPRIRRIFSQD